jgi:hypothetical protein
MADPVRCRLRPASRRGLTRPDQVTAPARPDGHTNPARRTRDTGQAAEPVSGEPATPVSTVKTPSSISTAPCYRAVDRGLVHGEGTEFAAGINTICQGPA